MMIECEQNNDFVTDEVLGMMELGIETEEELDELCEHYKCKWYELTFTVW